MRIAILGSGLMGAKLGTIFARAGHEVAFSYARHKDKLEQLARDAKGNARAAAPKEAVKDADVVLLAVNWSQVSDVLTQAGDLAGKVVATCCLPMNDENSALAVGHTSSGAEELALRMPGAKLVSAFQTVPSEVLFDVFEARNNGERPNLFISGDDAGSKALVSRLVQDAGFEPVDLGPLEQARCTEPFGLLMGHVAYEGSRGPAVAYRLRWFDKG